ncbi:MAG: ArsR/SmtB family transcription factor [Phycisphaerales bacterium]
MKRLLPKHGVAARLAVLAEPVRLRILRLLELEELSVGEVASVVQLPQSTVSRHLKALAEMDWLLKRQEGTATLYRLIMDDLTTELRAIWRPVREQVLADTSDAELESDRRRLKTVLAARRTDSRTFFGRVADEWHHLRTSLFGEGFTAPALLGLLRPDWTVADLGSGSGDASRYLAPVVERVVAVDQSEAMLEAGRRLLTEFSNIEFVCSDLESLPFADASIDAATLSLVLHHVEHPEQVLAECRRVLRSDRGGGVLLIVDMLAHDREEYRRTMGHHHLGFEASDLRRMLETAGFRRVSVRELPTGTKSKGPGLLAASARVEAMDRV